MGVGPEGSWTLRLFGAHVDQAFGHVPYQVGSSLTEKRDWRDVDVRLLLPDTEYAELFGDPVNAGRDSKLLIWNMAWSALGTKITGLPIDFQFQQQTWANKTFPGPRSALLLLDSDLPFARTT